MTLALEAHELLSPLYQENTVIGDQVVEPQGFQLSRCIDSVQIDVIEAGLWATVLVDQGERWAGDILSGRRPEGFRNTFDQRSLAGAEVAAQKHQLGRSKHPGQGAAERDSLLCGVGDEFLRRHAGRNQVTSIAIPFPRGRGSALESSRTAWG